MASSTTPSTPSTAGCSSACTPTWASSPRTPFDTRRTGLDHVSFGLPDSASLEAWGKRLDELGISHGGIKKAHYGSGISFADPDGIALEFFIAPGT